MSTTPFVRQNESSQQTESKEANKKVALINQPSALVGSKPPWVPPGEYEATCFGHTTKLMFGGRPKLFLSFVIRDKDGNFITLEKHYNLRRFLGQNQGFEIGHRCNLFRDYVRLFGYPKQLETFTSTVILNAFEGRAFTADIETVTKDWDGNDLTRDLHYSVIRRIKNVISA